MSGMKEGLISVDKSTMAFIVKVIDANRITIPKEYVEILHLKKGDLLSVSIKIARKMRK